MKQQQIINHNLIKSFNPCESRYENFAKEYPNFEGNLEQFLSLDNINHNDKVWVGVRLLSEEQRIRFALLCAESVLHIHESHNNDGILRKALTDYMNDVGNEELRLKLEYVAKYAAFTDTKIIYATNVAAADAAAYAAYAANAATYATHAAATYATNVAAAADAAAYAAYAAYAANAATYATHAAATYAAYAATAAAADARQKQENLNLLFLYEVYNHDNN